MDGGNVAGRAAKVSNGLGKEKEYFLQVKVWYIKDVLAVQRSAREPRNSSDYKSLESGESCLPTTVDHEVLHRCFHTLERLRSSCCRLLS